MTTTPIPTGKIRGSLRDVTPKLRNFVGAVKVTTPSGKGGILVEMGKPVASYLTVDGVLHRGKESLDLLEGEQLAEFEILRYDEEQFKEAMLICDNRGLLLGDEKGAAPAAAPPRAREAKPREAESVLSSMMKRFVAPKIGEKQAPAPAVPKPEPETLPPVPGTRRVDATEPEPPLPPPQPPAEKVPPAQEKTEAAPQETELSAIIKRLRESAKAEKGPAPSVPPGAGGGETLPKAGVFEREERVKVGEPPAPPVPRSPVADEKRPAGPVPSGGEIAVESQLPEVPVRVDLGKMMKRIKRLDITSIRDELQAGAEEGGSVSAGAREVTPPPAGEPGAPAPAAAATGKSDIDELKAFIQRLEVLEEPKEAPPERGLLAKLGVRSREAEPPAPPRKREVPAPVPRKEKVPEEAAPVEEGAPGPKAPGEREAARPAEPDRKAKIASILRRSGLVKPPAEEQPGEMITEILPEPVPAGREEPQAPAEEAGVTAPKALRKRVEITRVPKRPEKPPREPPLIDERMLQKILKQPGVIAVSTFFEGFAVQSAGRADFEQVAANAEDLFRAGKKIAREIDIGPLNQIILETGRGKLVIAPYGDLNVCIFTEPDANLGLIRIAIRSMQVEKG